MEYVFAAVITSCISIGGVVITAVLALRNQEKNHRYQARFSAEFDFYRELAEKLLKVRKALEYSVENGVDDNFDEAFVECKDFLYQNSPFIPKDIYKKFYCFSKRCENIYKSKKIDRYIVKKMKKRLSEIAEDIRAYLQKK